MSHLCHAEGCKRSISPTKAMCAYHWDKVPFGLQQDIRRLYRPGQERDKYPTIEYLDALQRAVNHVSKMEGRPARPLPSELIR